VKDLYTFFSFALFNNDPIVTNILANEIKKLEESTQDASKQILDYIEKISSYIVSTYPYLY
jgi:ABC-type polar amino acid transport system ATPase subunit